MNLLDAKIFETFFRFGLDAKDFNKLTDAEKNRHSNTVRFEVKAFISEETFSDAEKLNRVFKTIDRRVRQILFG